MAIPFRPSTPASNRNTLAKLRCDNTAVLDYCAGGEYPERLPTKIKKPIEKELNGKKTKIFMHSHTEFNLFKIKSTYQS
jgi:hypothetical protein